ncbi:hypothetical protein SteCoe_29852 [Stentor coeruleus]|uniref:FCP1 homology domain-containing protein n=1 Tax=Stentor coeruleus TaxID=5963 RepID=A0A1R2B4Z8_9CILI|nr:hypothetical protein SteCoe_29852 [Stentor coeruleus]
MNSLLPGIYNRTFNGSFSIKSLPIKPKLNLKNKSELHKEISTIPNSNSKVFSFEKFNQYFIKRKAVVTKKKLLDISSDKLRQENNNKEENTPIKIVRLSFVKKQILSNSQAIIKFPKANKSQKTLVLDLDETLICSKVDKQPEITLSGSPLLSFSIRPYAKELLEYAGEFFEVVIFTASTKRYADRILDYLDPSGKLIKYRFYRENCIKTDKGFIKDLSIIQGRELGSVIIVDDQPISYSYQRLNGFPVSSWLGDKDDNELLKLIFFLKTLKNIADVRVFIKKYLDHDNN